jgi:hypothetical protein
MTAPMSESERQDMLRSLGLNPNAPSLVADVKKDKPAKTKKSKVAAAVQENPQTMLVADIVFDPALLDEFPDLSGSNFKTAADKVFAIYRSPGRDPERNPLLWRKVGEFVQQVKRSRKSGGFVKEKVKATGEQREIANLLAAHNLTMEDLAKLLQEKA